jgi:hypothetical protein
MTILVYKTAVPDDFEAQVQKHLRDKLNHRLSTGAPAPAHPHPAVEAAVRRIPGTKNTPDDYVADYQLVDDRPPPPTLLDKKRSLIAQVSANEYALLESILPVNKRRLQFIKLHDLQTAITDGTIINPEEQEFIANEEKRQARFKAIDRKVATVMSEIEDLTDETIGAYQIPPLE